MISLPTSKRTLSFLLLLTTFSTARVVLGAEGEFTPLVGIPYIDTDDGNMSLPKYVNALYTASISIAAFLAVVKIIFAGVKYMLSDVVTTKADAKKDIRGALIGLLIVVGAVLILNTINPELKEINVLNGPPVGVELTGDVKQVKILNEGDSIRTCPQEEYSDNNCAAWCKNTIGGVLIGSAYQVNSNVVSGVTYDTQRPNCLIKKESDTGASDIVISDTTIPTGDDPEDTFSFVINENRDYTTAELNELNRNAQEAVDRGLVISYQAGVASYLSEGYRNTCERGIERTNRPPGVFVYMVDNSPGSTNGTVFCLPK